MTTFTSTRPHRVSPPDLSEEYAVGPLVHRLASADSAFGLRRRVGPALSRALRRKVA